MPELDLPKHLQERVRNVVLFAQDRVIEAVKNYVEGEGYSQVEVKLGTRHGIDVDATGLKGRLIIEAVGAYLTQQEDTNHFNSVPGQIIQRMSAPEPPDGIALPDTRQNRD